MADTETPDGKPVEPHLNRRERLYRWFDVRIGVVTGKQIVHVCRNIRFRKYNAGVLNRSIGEKQFRRDNPNAGTVQNVDQRVEPAIGWHRIVIEKDDDVGAYVGDPSIVATGKAIVSIEPQDADHWKVISYELDASVYAAVINDENFMPATIDQFEVSDPFDAQQNIEAGATFLKQLLDKYKGDIALALSAWIVIHFDRAQAGFTLITCVLYAGLYVISLFLETVYAGRAHQFLSLGAMLFSLILFTSVAAITSDAALSQSGRPEGLWISLLIFFATGVVQWLLIRGSLPDRSVVRATFESLTSQSAHLKNTAYFLLIVILFWIPPTHCRWRLNQEIRAGHPEVVRHSLASRSVLTPEGMICPPVEWLWVLFIVMVIVSIPMGARLIENLPPHPQRNTYLNLFYLRLIVYFSLVLTCLGWHSYSVGLLLR